MLWIHASLILAEMIDIKAFWDGVLVIFERPSVCPDMLTTVPEVPVPTSSTDPLPTTIISLLDLLQEPFDAIHVMA